MIDYILLAQFDDLKGKVIRCCYPDLPPVDPEKIHEHSKSKTKKKIPKKKHRTTIIGTKLEVTLTMDLRPPKITKEVSIVNITPIINFQLPLPIFKKLFGSSTSM